MHHVHASRSLDGRRPLTVAVDGRGRFVRVEVDDLDDTLRDVTRLSSAFDEAYVRALVGATSPAGVAPQRPGRRAVPAGPVLRSRPARPTPHVEPRWDLIAAGYGTGSDALPLSPTGASDNDCVHVRLDPASSRGRLVDVDPEWLHQTTTARLVAAIGQAFADAYRKRDHR